MSTYDVQDCFYQFKIPNAFGEPFGFKRIQAYKLGVQEVDGRAVAPLDWVTPVCAVLPMGCSWALHFCQQAHVNIALRTGLGRHLLLFGKTPVPLLSEAEPVVSVYVDNGGVLSTQRGKANTLRRQLERKLGEVALPTHEAEAETVCCLFVFCLLFVCCLFAVCLLFVCCLCAVCVLFVCCVV